MLPSRVPVRRFWDSRRIMLAFVLASLPAALAGAVSLGAAIVAALPGGLAGVADIDSATLVTAPLRLAAALEPALPAALVAGLVGGLYLLPPLAVAAAVSFGWAEAFARLRGRSRDPGWFLAAWLFVLLAPPGLPLGLAALALSFGLVFGSLVFGGTGRYIVNPALLGIVFAQVAYPDPFAASVLPALGGGIEPAATASGWSLVAANGTAAFGDGWLWAWLGSDAGTFGTPSDAASLIGLFALVALGIVSWRTPLAALAGLLLVGLGFDVVPWYWQPVLGSFAFAAAFVATDPTTMAATRAGRWLMGLVFGALTAAIRMLNPEHPEGTLYALLLASLVTPLIDHAATELAIRRRRARLER